jgi:hypothetical protein
MSKARKRFTDTPGTPRWIFPDFPEPAVRSDDDVDADVMRAASAAVNTLPREIMDAVRSTARRVVHYIGPTEWDSFKGYGPRKQLSGEVKDENEFITDLVMQAAEDGFRLALARYAPQLKHVPELAAWRQERKKGGDKGREGGTRKRVDLAQRIRDKWAAMEAAGENPTNASVAAAIKQEYGRGSVRTVQRAFAERAETTTPVKRMKR